MGERRMTIQEYIEYLEGEKRRSEEKAKQESVYWLRFGMQQLDDARDKMHDRLVAILSTMPGEGKIVVDMSIELFGRVEFCQRQDCNAVAVSLEKETSVKFCRHHYQECMREVSHDPA